MRISKIKYWSPLAVMIYASLLMSPAFGDEYYRWKIDGVVHYGSRPPQGVIAEKVTTWGKSAATSPTSESDNADDTNTEAAVTEEQKQLLAKRAEDCKLEQERLDALRTSGQRVRMKQADGTTKYLTAEELAKEIAQSEDFISQACK